MNIAALYGAYNPIISALSNAANGETYTEHFKSPNMEALAMPDVGLNELNSIKSAYVEGILERSRIAALTSLVRSQRWLSATLDAQKAGNAMGFAASLRGFLESAADAHDVMSYLPDTLAKMFPYLYLVLIKSSDVNRLSIDMGQLEAKLIHYVYARRKNKGEVMLPYHQNQTNADYIRAIEHFAAAGSMALYGELCELTHPAAASVSCFIDEAEHVLTFNASKDADVIDDLSLRYENTIEQLVIFSLNPALMSLSFLQRLIPEWAGPTDQTMQTVGNTQAMLHSFDSFIAQYQEGSWDAVEFARKIQK